MSKHLSIAYQLYSAREEMAADMPGTLAQIAQMGYQGVEFAGFFERRAKEIQKLMKKTGLVPISSHVPLQQIREDMHGVVAFHEEIGCPYVVVPYLVEGDRPGAAGFANVLRTLYAFGRLCKKHGLTLLYHNHDFEFVELSGQIGLDFLFDAIPADLLQTEIDTCWVKYAGADPAAYIGKYARRCPLVHIKDYEGVRGDRPPYALIGLETAEPAAETGTPFMFKPAGYGCQDVPSLVRAAKESHAKWLVVEQDESPERPALEDARMSADYLLGLEL